MVRRIADQLAETYRRGIGFPLHDCESFEYRRMVDDVAEVLHQPGAQPDDIRHDGVGQRYIGIALAGNCGVDRRVSAWYWWNEFEVVAPKRRHESSRPRL